MDGQWENFNKEEIQENTKEKPQREYNTGLTKKFVWYFHKQMKI